MSSHAPKVDAGAKLVFLISAAALLGAVYILVSSLINTYNKNSTKGEITTSSNVGKAAGNLKPIGVSLTSDAPAAAAPTAARSGKEVYGAVCQACHATGVAGSPKFGDKKAWEPRVATGLDSLMHSAMNGKGAMPARGGNPSVTDDELKATIIYMTKEAGFDLGGGSSAAPAAKAAPEPKKQAAAEAPKAAPATEKKEEPAAPQAPAAPEPKQQAAAEAPKAAPATEKKEEPVAPQAPVAKAEPAQPATPEKPSAPVAAATTATAAVAAKAGGASMEAGKKVYDTTCFACHKTGVAGAPIFGNKEAWAPRIATGADSLYNSVLKGKGAMPPKGGNTALADDDVKAAVDYMVSQSQ